VTELVACKRLGRKELGLGLIKNRTATHATCNILYVACNSANRAASERSISAFVHRVFHVATLARA